MCCVPAGTATAGVEFLADSNIGAGADVAFIWCSREDRSAFASSIAALNACLAALPRASALVALVAVAAATCTQKCALALVFVCSTVALWIRKEVSCCPLSLAKARAKKCPASWFSARRG